MLNRVEPVAAISDPPDDRAAAASHSRATTRAVFANLGVQGYAFALLGVAAPFIATSFRLDQSGIARMYAWISLNAFGALILSRMADRAGRRQLLLFCLIATGLCSLDPRGRVYRLRDSRLRRDRCCNHHFHRNAGRGPADRPARRRSGDCQLRYRYRRRRLRDSRPPARALCDVVALALRTSDTEPDPRAVDDSDDPRESALGARGCHRRHRAKPILRHFPPLLSGTRNSPVDRNVDRRSERRRRAHLDLLPRRDGRRALAR